MALNNYRIAESTLLTNARIFSMKTKTHDLQNGAIVGKSDLVEGETEIYQAKKIAEGDSMYLVLSPAWSYSDRLVKQNEENFTNKAGIPFRAYRLEKDMKFKIGNIDLKEAKVGDHVKYVPDEDKFEKCEPGDNCSLKIVHIEEVGFPYCIGSAGAQLDGDEENEYGYVLGGPTKKYTVEVMADTYKESGE